MNCSSSYLARSFRRPSENRDHRSGQSVHTPSTGCPAGAPVMKETDASAAEGAGSGPQYHRLGQCASCCNCGHWRCSCGRGRRNCRSVRWSHGSRCIHHLSNYGSGSSFHHKFPSPCASPCSCHQRISRFDHRSQPVVRPGHRGDNKTSRTGTKAGPRSVFQ